MSSKGVQPLNMCVTSEEVRHPDLILNTDNVSHVTDIAQIYTQSAC